MSKIIISFLLLLMVTRLAAQTTVAPELSREVYLEKSEKLKTTATLMVAAGVGMTIAGLIMSNTQKDEGGGFGAALVYLDKLPGYFVATLGMTIALCSIPVFIKARKYERKAAIISFGNQKIISPYPPGFISTSQPTFSLKIKL